MEYVVDRNKHWVLLQMRIHWCGTTCIDLVFVWPSGSHVGAWRGWGPSLLALLLSDTARGKPAQPPAFSPQHRGRGQPRRWGWSWPWSRSRPWSRLQARDRAHARSHGGKQPGQGTVHTKCVVKALEYFISYQGRTKAKMIDWAFDFKGITWVVFLLSQIVLVEFQIG